MELALAVAGLVLGFALSFFLWWMLNHRLVPAIAFGNGISKLPYGSDGRIVYRIKIKNTGHRDIIDLESRVRVYLPKMNVLRPESKANTRIIDVPLHEGHLFALKAGKTCLLRLDLSKANTEFLPGGEGERIRTEKDGSLEALFALKQNSYLLVEILAYDSFSGARKYYGSQEYTSDDIVLGYFKKLEVVEEESPQAIAVDLTRREAELTREGSDQR